MRGARGLLLPRIVVAPIRRYQSVPFDRWPAGHYKVMPLPALRGAEDEARAVHLLELAAARSSDLSRGDRILTLTERGINVLQQRLVFSLTRVEVGLDRLHEQSAHVLLEAELEEEWVDELAATATPDHLSAAATQFAEFMDEGHRRALVDPTRRSDTVRAVRAEVRRRVMAADAPPRATADPRETAGP